MKKGLIKEMDYLSKYGAKKEKEIAKYLNVDRNYSKLTATNLANQCYVSISYVTKFCKKLGFSGFNDFKYHLVHEYENQKLTKDQYSNFSVQNYKNDVQHSIESTVQQIDFSQLQFLSQKIINSQQIYIYAVDDCEIIANELTTKLIRLGINCLILNNQRMLETIIKNDKDNSILIYVSFNEKPINLERINNLLAAKKLKSIIITEDSNQQNITAFDYKLNYLNATNYYQGFPISLRVSINTITDMLYLTIYENMSKNF